MAPFSLARNAANLVESFHIQRHRRGLRLIRVWDELLNFRPSLNQLLVSIVQVQHTGNGEFERIILRAQLATGLVVAVQALAEIMVRRVVYTTAWEIYRQRVPVLVVGALPIYATNTRIASEFCDYFYR